MVTATALKCHDGGRGAVRGTGGLPGIRTRLAWDSGDGSTLWELLLDGVVAAGFEIQHTKYWDARHVHYRLSLTAGVAHTVGLTRVPWTGSRPAVFGGPYNGRTWPRTMLQINDLTVARA